VSFTIVINLLLAKINVCVEPNYRLLATMWFVNVDECLMITVKDKYVALNEVERLLCVTECYH